MIAFKLFILLLLRLARFHYTNSKNTKQYLRFQIPFFLSNLFPFMRKQPLSGYGSQFH